MPTGGSGGISGFGTTVSGATTGTIGSILKVDVGNIECNKIDITNMESVGGWKEWIAGLKSQGEIKMDCLYLGSDFSAFLTTGVGGDEELWTITFPDGSTFVCYGFISSLGNLSAPLDDKMTFSVTITLTGQPEFTADTPA